MLTILKNQAAYSAEADEKWQAVPLPHAPANRHFFNSAATSKGVGVENGSGGMHGNLCTKAPLNNGNRAQRSAEASRARRVAQVMAVALGKRRNAALDASVPALRGFQATPHSALPLFGRQPACLQSGALIADLPESLSALPLFRGALIPSRPRPSSCLSSDGCMNIRDPQAIT